MDSHLDNYGLCAKCHQWAYTSKHKCPPAWLCWEPEMAAVDAVLVDGEWVDSPDLPSSDTDGLIANGARRAYAQSPITAAEEYARACDNHAAEWDIEVRIVYVRLADEPAAEPHEYRVEMEMVPQYSATLHGPARQATP